MDLNTATRRSVRLTNHDYLAGMYFVTICTVHRIPLFGEIQEGKMILNRFGYLVRRQWESTGRLRNNIHLDAFIIMPDHIHAILRIQKEPTAVLCRGTLQCAPTRHPRHVPQRRFGGSTSGSLAVTISAFKSGVTRSMMRMGYPHGAVWQRGFWDRVIRDEDELWNTREYIRLNPAKWEEKSGHSVDLPYAAP